MGVESRSSSTSTPSLTLPLQGGGDVGRIESIEFFMQHASRQNELRHPTYGSADEHEHRSRRHASPPLG